MRTAERDYEECGAYHTARRNQEWYNLWTQSNPASPLNTNQDGSVVRVQVHGRHLLPQSQRALGRGPGCATLKARRPPGSTEH